MVTQQHCLLLLLRPANFTVRIIVMKPQQWVDRGIDVLQVAECQILDVHLGGVAISASAE
jgi:hypothetical protein